MKKNKVLIAEIIIIAAIVVAFLLYNLVGTTTIKATDNVNAIRTFSDMNGKTVAFYGEPEIEESIFAFVPEAKVVQYEDIYEMAEDLESGKISVFFAKEPVITELKESYTNLCVYPQTIRVSSVVSVEDWYYAVMLEENCGFGTTTKTLDNLNDESPTIAIISGTVQDEELKKQYPNCTITYYATSVDTINSVSAGLSDYALCFTNSADMVFGEYEDLAFIPEPVSFFDNCFVVKKSEKGKTLLNQFNEYLAQVRENGEYGRMERRWLTKLPENYYEEDRNYTGENGKLKIVTACAWIPYSFIYENRNTGFFVDLTNGFCEKYGYIPEYYIADFQSELAGIDSGEYDLMADVAESTPERQESSYLTDSVATDGYMLVTKADKTPTVTVSKASQFTKSFANRFYKNFIEEDRWKMILDGLIVTIEISVLAVLFGTILGGIICACRMSKAHFAEAFGRIYIKVFQSTPIVVLLMVLYYIVFSGTGVSAFWVAVVGFSADFSSYAAEMFRTNIEAVPEGQFKAALALGFSKKRAFTKVVLPQAMIGILPLYSGQIITTVKLTSVAGYVAVIELTKVSDLIRVRTFDAFFPLISTAIIYFVLAALLTSILKHFAQKTDPAVRDRKIKGVIEHD